MGRPFAGLGSDSLDSSPHAPTEEESLPANGPPRDSGVAVEDWDVKDSVLATVSDSAKIEQMVSDALSGRLPRNRPLKYWEPDKLNPRHISIIMMRAVGYKQNRIAELLGYEQSTVSIILGHPDSKKILSAILSESALQAVNISAVVQKHAPKMLTIVKDVAEDTEEKTNNRLKAAFKWLDMYQTNVEKAKGEEKPLSISNEAADRLTRALQEAHTARDVPYVLVGKGDSEGGSGSASADGPSEDSSSLPDEAPALELQRAEEIEALQKELEAELGKEGAA